MDFNLSLLKNIVRISLEDGDTLMEDESDGEDLSDIRDVSFGSNDSTIVDVSESRGKSCSQCHKMEGEYLLVGTPVIFGLKKGGKRYGRCRRCRQFINEIKNPIHNPINNLKISFPSGLPRMTPMFAPPLGAALDSEGDFCLEQSLTIRERTNLKIGSIAIGVKKLMD